MARKGLADSAALDALEAGRSPGAARSDDDDEMEPLTSRALSDRDKPASGGKESSHRSQAVLASAGLLLIAGVPLAALVLSVSQSSGLWAPTSPLVHIFTEAARSGVAGGLSMVINVLCFMWLRTTVNYQQAHGSLTTREALAKLYAEGGVLRFYRGLLPALLQAPLSRFGDTASNALLHALVVPAGGMQTAGTTALATLLTTSWRLLITPVDTFKTMLQVTGASGTAQLRRKVAAHGMLVLWDGAFGGAAATAVGFFPWFYTYNLLDLSLPPAARGTAARVVRHGVMGLAASVLSDCCSNGVRVVKVVKQTFPTQISYLHAMRRVLEADGVVGLATRGLGTKLMTNAMQSMLFSVVWRLLRDRLHPAG